MKKLKVLRIRMNDAEGELLEKRAAAAGVKPTRYAKMKVFPKKDLPHPLWPQFMEWMGKQAVQEIKVLLSEDKKSTCAIPDHLVIPPETMKQLKSVATKSSKVKIYKNIDEAMRKDFKPDPKVVKAAEASYRRFAEPGALLKK